MPAGRGGGALRMGLSRVAEDHWLDPAPDRATRAAAFAEHPNDVVVLPGSELAGEEVAALVGACGGLADAAHHTHEDLCLLQPDACGTHRLTAGALAWPSDWRLADKIGRPLLQVHAPIHGYAEQLSPGVDHFITNLRPGAIFGRTNWFVVPSGAMRWLPQDAPERRFAHVTAANAGDTLFVRCERQTLRRLPRSGAVLFTIGIYTAPLGRLSHAAVHRIANNVASLPPGERQRRDAPMYADALAAYAARQGSGLKGAV